ncbi:MAG: Helix-turn-helix domain protein [Myxococcales bacterium]|nr:Helix-turn-helix domain protein [Myxococcales bacterium]
MTLAELSRSTKIKEGSLTALEEARFEALPARVFVVGYVGAYARAVGLDAGEALELLATSSPAAPLGAIGECMAKVVARAPAQSQPDGERPLADRRRVGVVVVVFLLLIVATLTLSLLLHHGGRVGGGMS